MHSSQTPGIFIKDSNFQYSDLPEMVLWDSFSMDGLVSTHPIPLPFTFLL